MNDNPNRNPSVCPARCCPCGDRGPDDPSDVTRRGFLESTAIAGLALGGLSWSTLSAAESEENPAPQRRPLVVKPVLVHRISTRAPKTSWRIWGGLQTQEDADREADLQVVGSRRNIRESVRPVRRGSGNGHNRSVGCAERERGTSDPRPAEQ